MRKYGLMAAALCLAGLGLGGVAAADERKLEDVQKEIVEKFSQVKTLKANYSTFSERDTEKYVFRSKGTGGLEYASHDGKQLLRMNESRTMETEFKEKDRVVIGGKNMQGNIAAEFVVDGEFAYTIMDQGGAKSIIKHRLDAPNLPRFGQVLFDTLKTTHDLTLLPDEKHGTDEVFVINAQVKEMNKDNPLAATRYYFRKSDGVLLKTTNHEVDGDKYSTTTYTELQLNIPFNPERFKLNVPPGTPISDQTVPLDPAKIGPTMGGKAKDGPTSGPAPQPKAPAPAGSQPASTQPAPR